MKKKIHLHYIKKVQRVYLEFAYSKSTVDDIRHTGAEYCRKMRQWFYLTDFEIIRSAVQYLGRGYEITVTAEVNELMLTLQNKKSNALIDKDYASSWNWARNPFDHQRETFNRALSKPAFLMSLDMGMGKTYTSLEVARYCLIEGRAKKVIISCPNHLKYNWEAEIKLAIPDLDVNVAILDGTNAKRVKQIKSDHDIMIINHENCRIPNILAELKKQGYDLLIIDEIHAFRNAKAQQSKGMYQLAQTTKYRYGLTGTPISGKDITGYFGIFRILDPAVIGFNSLTAFKRYYCILDYSRGYEQILDYKNLNEFYEKLAPNVISYKIDEVMDMPERTYKNTVLQFSDKDMKRYKEFEKHQLLEFLSDMDSGEMTAQNALTKMLRLRQMTSGFVTDDESGIIENINSYKIDALREMMRSEYEGTKLVIACNFKHEIKMIAELLRSLKIDFVEYHGEIKTKQRHINTERFRDEPKCQVLVGMLSTFIGFNADVANHMLLFSQTYSHDHFDQGCARIFRPNQKNNCIYNSLVMDKTIDTFIQEVLSSKGSFIENIRIRIREKVNE